MAEPSATYSLAAICRCIRDDLGLSAADCDRPLEQLRSHKVITDFLEKRRDSPVGGEVIQVLAPSLIAYSLHSGRFRAAMWHHELLGVVWLLAAALHCQDSAKDAYPYFGQLQTDGKLLPTREDIARVVRERTRTFARSLLDDVAPLWKAAKDHPGQVQEATLDGRARVRVLYELG